MAKSIRASTSTDLDNLALYTNWIKSCAAFQELRNRNMIDITTENLMAMSAVPKYLPRRSNNKPVHVATVYRWALKGLDGTKLETIKVGSTTYTSTQAVQRFANILTRGSAPTPVTSVSRNRQAQARRAGQEIRKQLGITNHPGRNSSGRM